MLKTKQRPRGSPGETACLSELRNKMKDPIHYKVKQRQRPTSINGNHLKSLIKIMSLAPVVREMMKRLPSRETSK
jgi:hypothetical protein